MKRAEFMTQLAALLQDLPADERKEALQYYEDYFRDAGETNEAEVIEELGSPRKVADTIREGLGVPKWEQKGTEVVPGPKAPQGELNQQNNRILKILLIVGICILASPAIGGALAVVIGIVTAVLGVFVALVVGAIAMVVAGVIVFCSGILCVVPEVAMGLALMGTGLVLLALGAMLAVASVWVAAKVFAAGCRGFVYLCRIPFRRREVAS